MKICMKKVAIVVNAVTMSVAVRAQEKGDMAAGVNVMAGLIKRFLFIMAIVLAMTGCKSEDKEQTDKQIEAQMIFVQGGTFIMGCTSEQSNCADDEKPTHSVTLSDFYIGQYEVTQGQWEAVMGTSVNQQRDKNNPTMSLYGKGDNYPMYYVNMNDVQEFIQKLNAQTGKQYRLPTEAEWEYAARGGNKSQGYKYSGSDNADDVAWYSQNSSGATHPVGTKSPNELGIYDMSGNVEEWCSDKYGKYSSNAQTNPQGSSSGLQVIRGGAHYMLPVNFVRVSSRSDRSSNSRFFDLGFRLVCEAK